MELFSIASGSSGNCICVGDDRCHLMIDAGISGKRIEAGMNKMGYTTKDMDGMLITHEHSDHVSGLGVVARKYGLPIYATKGTIAAIRRTKSLGTINDGLFHPITAGEPFTIGGITVDPVHISHDAADPVAYFFESGQKRIGVVTDLGYYDDVIMEKMKNLDALLVEANHDIHMLQAGSYPYPLKQRILGERGHLSNESCGQLLSRILHDSLKYILLGHLSRENNYPELAFVTVQQEITLGDNPYRANDFPIEIAARDQVSRLVTV